MISAETLIIYKKYTYFLDVLDDDRFTFFILMMIVHLILKYFLMQDYMLYINIISFEMIGLLLKDNDII